MIRFIWTFDKDMEEAWLNDYCQQGWAMASFFAGLTTFVPCEPGEFVYRIDLLPGSGLRADNYEDYVIFMNEMGVEVLQRWGRWVYLRKRAEDGPFEIYTDISSRIALYRRIRKLFLWTLVVELCCSLSGWPTLLRFPHDPFVRGIAGVYIVLISVIVQAVWRSSRQIRELQKKLQ